MSLSVRGTSPFYKNSPLSFSLRFLSRRPLHRFIHIRKPPKPLNCKVTYPFTPPLPTLHPYLAPAENPIEAFEKKYLIKSLLALFTDPITAKKRQEIALAAFSSKKGRDAFEQIYAPCPNRDSPLLAFSAITATHAYLSKVPIENAKAFANLFYQGSFPVAVKVRLLNYLDFFHRIPEKTLASGIIKICNETPDPSKDLPKNLYYFYLLVRSGDYQFRSSLSLESNLFNLYKRVKPFQRPLLAMHYHAKLNGDFFTTDAIDLYLHWSKDNSFKKMRYAPEYNGHLGMLEELGHLDLLNRWQENRKVALNDLLAPHLNTQRELEGFISKILIPSGNQEVLKIASKLQKARRCKHKIDILLGLRKKLYQRYDPLLGPLDDFLKRLPAPKHDFNEIQVYFSDSDKATLGIGDAFNTCLSLENYPDAKGVLGYLLNGQNKILFVAENKGAPPLARSVIRLLHADKKPLLFLENPYVKEGANRAFFEKGVYLMAFAMSKELSLPLYMSFESPYVNKASQVCKSLSSHGGATILDYFDSGGLCKNLSCNSSIWGYRVN